MQNQANQQTTINFWVKAALNFAISEGMGEDYKETADMRQIAAVAFLQDREYQLMNEVKLSKMQLLELAAVRGAALAVEKIDAHSCPRAYTEWVLGVLKEQEQEQEQEQEK